MNGPMGEYGGVVTRKLILFSDEHKVGEEISPEILENVSLRHRIALQGAGLIRYYSEPEGVAAGFISVEPLVEVTKKKKAKKKTVSKKKKTKKTTPSKSSSTKRR